MNQDANTKSWLDRIMDRASEIPGAMDYPAPRLPKRGGGKFSNAFPKTDTEWKVYMKKDLPGPGQYDLPALGEDLKGGQFSTAKPKDDVQVLMDTAKEIPAPGDYNPRELDKASSNQRFNLSNPKSYLEWIIYNSKQSPAPGDYKINAGKSSAKIKKTRSH